MAASAYLTQVQQIYVAYYGRPADPLGQQYWANKIDAAKGDLAAIINAFGTSDEAKALYASKNDAQAVNALYQQLFGRDADVDGLKFYVNGLQTGKFTLASVALDVFNGASGDDKTITANKVKVADEFTKQLDTTSEITGYSGNVAAGNARSFLATVNKTDVSVTNAVAKVGDTIKTVTSTTTSGSTGTGENKVFTSAVGELLAGGDLDDTFKGVVKASAAGVIASDSTIHTGDSVDGKTGYDTLNILTDWAASGAVTLATPAVQATSAEKVLITNATANASSGAVTVDMNLVSGAKVVAVDTFNGYGIKFDKVANLVDVDFADGTAAKSDAVEVAFNASAVAGSADAINVTLKGNAASGRQDTLTANGVETINATVKATESLNLDATGSTLKTLKIAGDGNLTLKASAAIATFTTVDATGFNGKLDVTNASAATNLTTIIGGNSDDTITIAKANAKVTGGLGKDTIDLVSGGVDGGTAIFKSAAESTVSATDKVVGQFVAAGDKDKIDLSAFAIPSSVGGNVTYRTVFDKAGVSGVAYDAANTNFFKDGGVLKAAAAFTVGAQNFLAIDLNQDGAFSSADLIIEVTGSSSTTAANLAGSIVWA